jgi:trk system potassium uptake protein TrkA
VKVIIAGCGRTGSTLARMLSESHEVAIIDRTPDAFRRLGKSFKGKKLVGQGTDADILKRTGIEGADVFVAVTDGDNRNIMAAQLAREVFGVERVLARIYDPSRAATYAELGIQTFCTTAISAGFLRDVVQGVAPAPLTAHFQTYLDEARGV